MHNTFLYRFQISILFFFIIVWLFDTINSFCQLKIQQWCHISLLLFFRDEPLILFAGFVTCSCTCILKFSLFWNTFINLAANLPSLISLHQRIQVSRPSLRPVECHTEPVAVLLHHQNLHHLCKLNRTRSPLNCTVSAILGQTSSSQVSSSASLISI